METKKEKKIESIDGEKKIETPETPEELFEAVHDLEARVKGREEDAWDEITALRDTVKTLRMEYADDPETMALIGKTEKLLDELEQSLEITYKVEGATEHCTSPEELAELQAYREKYQYSEEKFSSKDEYMDFLAQNLTSPEEINLFLKHLYRYDLSHEEGRSHYIMNMGTVFSNDWWQNPLEMATDYSNGEGRFIGDCDDIAILFEEILSRQGKHPFYFAVPGHALTGWIEETGDGRYTAYVVDTTSEGRNLGDAMCRKLEGKPGQTQEDVFMELVNSFSGKSDAKATFNPDQMSLGFYISEDAEFDIPASFALAERYEEIRGFLEEENFEAVLDIVSYEIEKKPDSINLKIARLQFQLLTNADSQEIQESIRQIVAMCPENQQNRNARDNINQTAYFLTAQGYAKEAVDLLEPLIESYNETFFDINLNDTLSDIYVENGDFEKAYQNDVKILQEVADFEEATRSEFGERAPIHYWKMYGQTSMDVFRDMVVARLNHHAEYKAYVSKKELPDFFREIIDRS